MIITTKSRYAIMSLAFMAQRPDLSKPVSISDISDSQGITVNYLEQIFSKLKKHKIVDSYKGPGGGYIIAKALKDTYVIDLIDAVEEDIKFTRCDHGASGCMPEGKMCITHNLWSELENQIRTYLSNISLSDFASGKFCVGSIKNLEAI